MPDKPRPLSAEEFRRAMEALAANKDAVIAELERIEREAEEAKRAVLERFGMSIPENASLSSVSNHANRIDTMSSAELNPGTPGPKFSSKHPLPARIKELGKSTPKVARELSKALGRPISRPTVRSWYLPKDHRDGRAIPEDAARFFEAKPWSIHRSAWKHGITSPD